MQVNRTASVSSMEVRVDCESLTSRAGTALLVGLADRVGLTDGLTRALAEPKTRSLRHEPGKVVRDLAVMLADGGDALCDLGALRDQPTLFGPVASDSTAFRLIETLDETRVKQIHQARAEVRARVWEASSHSERVILDIDATLVTAHSEKEGAAGNYKGGFGFHPLLCFEARTGEALAGILRPGNAGSNTAADHIRVLAAALSQLPETAGGRGTLVRTDIGGATHAFLDTVSAAGLSFSVGYELSENVRQATLNLPESAWVQALDADGRQRDGAWVSELDLDLLRWPEGTRAICRRERPHPGAQLSFTDSDGYRFQVFITNQRGGRIARLEQIHRARAAIEDNIRCAKDSGLRNLPFRSFAHNEAWLALVMVGTDLVSWAQQLLLEGEIAACEPKRLRYRILHVAARITRHARRIILHLPTGWSWAADLVRAFARLRTLPSG